MPKALPILLLSAAVSVYGEEPRGEAPSLGHEQPQVYEILARPEVGAALNEAAAKQLERGTFPNEDALLAAILQVAPDVTPDMMPTIRASLRNVGHPEFDVRASVASSEGEAKRERSRIEEIRRELIRPELGRRFAADVGQAIRDGEKITRHELAAALAEAARNASAERLVDLLDDPDHPVETKFTQDDLPPVEVVLAELEPKHRELLIGYEDVLRQGMGAYLDIRASLPANVSEAISAFFSMSLVMRTQPGRLMSPAEADELRQMFRQAEQRGYWDRTDDPAPSLMYLSMARQARLQDSKQHHKLLSPRARVLELAHAGADDLAELRGAEDYLRTRPVPAHVVTPSADGYAMVTAPQSLVHVYAETSFGAPLMVAQERSGGVFRYNPETGEMQPTDDMPQSPDGRRLTIAGKGAYWSVSKHQGDVWATTVKAYDGTVAYTIEVAAKLEGGELEAFLELARRIVEGG